MLALETGWTPNIIGQLPAAFRAACHWAILARTVVPAEGLSDMDIPFDADPAMKLAIVKARAATVHLREFLFPDDV